MPNIAVEKGARACMSEWLVMSFYLPNERTEYRPICILVQVSILIVYRIVGSLFTCNGNA